jgi:peptidoglycan/xylan/chitin deacetylase (PgdA/CDA1 family)
LPGGNVGVIFRKGCALLFLEIVILITFFAVIALLASYALVAPRSQWLGKMLVSGDPQSPAVCLTFDDGPGDSTPLILDTLKRLDVRATFFLLGENVERLPELARRIAEEGHEIANHSYSHPYFFWKMPGRILWEVRRAQEVIETATGRRPTLFRPPYGVRWFGLSSILRKLRLTAVMWSVSSVDWRFPASRIVERVNRKTRAGSIILLHDGVPGKEGGDRRATAEALDQIIQTLAKRYRFVTASEMIP